MAKAKKKSGKARATKRKAPARKRSSRRQPPTLFESFLSLFK